jgi:hypothetical protein
MKENEPAYPTDVAALGAATVVTDVERSSKLIEQARLA